jgi:hypothetical protein
MRCVTLLAALLLVFSTLATAKDNDDSEAGHSSSTTYRNHLESFTFNSAERNLIRSWLVESERLDASKHPPSEIPPGLEKKEAHGKALPPGWQRKLVRGEPLDNDFYRLGRTLPDNLLRKLPPPPPGSEILQIEDQIIRLDATTRTILDVFDLGHY